MSKFIRSFYNSKCDPSGRLNWLTVLLVAAGVCLVILCIRACCAPDIVTVNGKRYSLHERCVKGHNMEYISTTYYKMGSIMYPMDNVQHKWVCDSSVIDSMLMSEIN